MVAHSGAKPFKCSLCQTRFAFNGGLKSHMLTHNLDKAYNCEYPECNKRFGTKSAMNSHLKSHFSEKRRGRPRKGEKRGG